MTNRPQGRPSFFVYIIESPSPSDLYHRRLEGDLIAQAVRLDGIPCVSRLAITAEAFKAAIVVGLPEEMKAHRNLPPVIHISAHGGKKGIQLSDGSLLTWEDLRTLLQPVNVALNGALILCMSSCDGFTAIEMAMREHEGECAFGAIVGHAGSPTWSETAVAYAAFYHLVSTGHDLLKSVEAMRAAAGTPEFQISTASLVRTKYLEKLNEARAQGATRQLEQRAAEANVPENAKQLERPPSTRA